MADQKTEENIINDQLPDGWTDTILGNVLKIGRGSSPRPIQDFITNKPGIPRVKIADATASDTRYLKKTKEFIREEGRSTSVSIGDLIVSNSATPGIPKFMWIDACVHDWWLVFSEYKDLDKLYLYYFFLDYRIRLEHSAFGTVFKNLTTEIVRNVPIFLPPFKEQQAIATALSSFDDKIELLQEENKTLEKTTQTIFQEWFGKYEVDNNLPEEWRVGKLGEVIENFDSQRIPITSSKRKKWIYPYYWATWINDYVQDYIFDGIYTLLWEDWSVIKDNGKPFTQYVWWKIWVNNHSHVLQGKNWFSTELIKIILDRTDIAPYVNGAVQLKINQSNMNSIPVIIPNQENLDNFDKVIQPIFWKIRTNIEQIQSLVKTRDELLPRLMKGEIRVNLSV